MTYRISKELFEVVMKEKIIKTPKIENLVKTKNVITYMPINTAESHVATNWKGISINDFFFKCKEWAEKFTTIGCGYGCWYISSGNGEPSLGHLEKTGWAKILVPFKLESSKHPPELIEGFLATTEQQAVFDACQWILDKKGN